MSDARKIGCSVQCGPSGQPEFCSLRISAGSWGVRIQTDDHKASFLQEKPHARPIEIDLSVANAQRLLTDLAAVIERECQKDRDKKSPNSK